MKYTNFLLLSACALLTSLLPIRAECADKFTIIVLPDTQREIKAKPGVFLNRMQWIKAFKDDLNLKFVGHTGDMVDWDTPDHTMYVTASEGYRYLDEGNIPYAISPGNHDTGAVDVGGGAKPPPNNAHINVRDTITFNNYFPASRFKAMAGQYESGKEDNSYHTFNAGGLDWMVITMEFCPRAGAVAWAKSVVQNHPNHNVIFVTHYYLEGNSTISTSNAGYGDTSGMYLFDQVVKQYSNVKMVFCGHVGVQGYRTDVGVNGNTIYKFLGTYHDQDINPTRILEIDPAGSINTYVYIPSTGQNKNDGSARVINNITWVQPAGTPKPAAPSALTANATSATQINLAWTDNASNETGFKIERKTGAAGTWSQIATTGANVKIYSNTGLAASTQYYYRVRANNAAGDSAYSNEANATTQAAVTAPPAPSNLIATATSTTQVSVTWTDNSGNETGFKLEGKTGATGAWSQIALPAANATSWNGAGLAPNTQYFFRIRATNAAGDSAYSNEASVTTFPNPIVGTGTGLRGQYFDNMDFTALKLSRVDPYIDFAWAGQPEASVAADTFSVIWRGEVQAQYTTTYTFYTLSDDGIRLWVNNVKLIDNWTDHSETENSGTIALNAGQKYAIRIEYYENGVSARAKLAWSSALTTKQNVPTSQLYPAPANRAPTLVSSITAAPNPATTDNTVAFTSAGNDADGDTLDYAWNFGDGTSAMGANASHKYGVPGTYTATVTVNDSRGGTTTGSVTVTVASPAIPPVSIKVNFQLAGAPVPAGYLQDNGNAFGDRGNGYSYGWNVDNTPTARDRNAANSPDQRYDTLVHMQKPELPNCIWEIALPNGTYTVRLVAGDPSYFDSIYKINVEGALTVDATPTATAKWFEGKKTVTVGDGRLTVSNAAGSANNKLAFIEINNGATSRELAEDATEALPLTVTKLQLTMNFSKPGRDSYRVAGALEPSDDFTTSGVAASIDVGAAIGDFTLDAKGRGKNKSGTIALKKSSSGWLFQASLKKGIWSDEWSDGGLQNQNVTGLGAEIPVTLTLNGQAFGGSKALTYKAKEKKTGAAK